MTDTHTHTHFTIIYRSWPIGHNHHHHGPHFKSERSGILQIWINVANHDDDNHNDDDHHHDHRHHRRHDHNPRVKSERSDVLQIWNNVARFLLEIMHSSPDPDERSAVQIYAKHIWKSDKEHMHLCTKHIWSPVDPWTLDEISSLHCYMCTFVKSLATNIQIYTPVGYYPTMKVI